jgi:hypothetical protein
MAFQFTFGGDGLPMNVTTVTIGAFRKLTEVRVHSPTAPTTSENLTLTLISHRGTNYNQLLLTKDLATVTDYRVTKNDIEADLEPGDKLQAQYTNTDGQKVTLIAVTEAA